MQRELIILGVTHHTAPVAIREKLAFSNGQLAQGLERLCHLPTIEEGAILSTCNRVELLATSPTGDRAIGALTDFLAETEELPRAELERHLSVYRGPEAIRHLFRVAASLDSLVVGEPQILGQLKNAYQHAADHGTTGIILHRCFQHAFSVAKRIRTETGIARKAVSVSSAAVELTRQIFDNLTNKTVMLIGTGDVGELAAQHFCTHGVRNTIVTNRTFDRAVALARQLNGTPVPFDTLHRYLHMADVVIGSTAATDYVLTPQHGQEALRERQYRPIFLIDLSVPRNFDPRLNDLDNVYLYDIDDLSSVAEDNRNERSREAEKAETIVEREVQHFDHWLASLDAAPTIVALRQQAEIVRQQELDKTLARLPHLSSADQAHIALLTDAIVKKMLHTPMTQLKRTDDRDAALYIAAIQHLFALQEHDDS